MIELSKIVKLEDGKYAPKIPMHPDLWNSLNKQFPKLESGAPMDRRDKINTNILPKIGVAINESIQALALEYGTRLDKDNKYSEANTAQMPDDLIVATMVFKTMNKPMKSVKLETGHDTIVSDPVISMRFGEGVLQELHELQDAMAVFDSAVRKKAGRNADPEAAKKLLEKIEPKYASAIAAIKSAELKEAIRIKGFREFELIEQYTHIDAEKDHAVITKALHAKLSALGLDSEDMAIAQTQLLAKSYREMETVLQMDGIAPAIAAPITEIQMPVVKQVLTGKMKAQRMVGYEGPLGDKNGQALAMYHRKLPIMDFNVKGNEDHPATLVKALMETSRYHHNTYRKGNNSIIGHLVQTASMGSRDLDVNLRPIVGTTLLMHDLAEDGGVDVAALDNSLKMIRDRFSPLIAELVGDLTDAADKKQSHDQGKTKGKLTRELKNFVFADKDDRWTNPENPLTPTNPDRPYALTNAGPKIADRRATMLEMMNDPDCMSGYSAHSGWRIGWRLNSKGFVDDVVQHIVDQVQKFDTMENKEEFYLPTIKDVPTRVKMINGLRNSLNHEFKTDDLFAAQNLTILADEFGLKNEERKRLIEDFTNPAVSKEQFRATVDELLTEERIKAAVAVKATPGQDYSVMYKRAERNPDPKIINPPIRTDENLQVYREKYLHRLQMREQIGSKPIDLVNGVEAKNMVDLYDKSHSHGLRDDKNIVGDDSKTSMLARR